MTHPVSPDSSLSAQLAARRPSLRRSFNSRDEPPPSLQRPQRPPVPYVTSSTTGNIRSAGSVPLTATGFRKRIRSPTPRFKLPENAVTASWPPAATTVPAGITWLTPPLSCQPLRSSGPANRLVISIKGGRRLPAGGPKWISEITASPTAGSTLAAPGLPLRKTVNSPAPSG